MERGKQWWIAGSTAAALVVLGGCPQPRSTQPPAPPTARPSVAQSPRPTPPPQGNTDDIPPTDLIARGKAVYFGTDYSGTGLTCAHCHASAPHDADMRLYIAHTAYGAAVRGAWWVRDAEQLKTGQGDAPTLSAAAQRCIDATYMNVKPRPLSPADSAALEAYLHHIANDAAPDSKPFVRALARAVPSAALRPDKGNGKGIYLNSCTLCHGVGLAGIPQLNKLKTRLTPQQVMAKVRGLGDAPASDTEGGFAAGGMPAYSTDILSDQQVTDVAYYICEDL